MNVFLVIALHIASAAVMVVTATIALYIVALVGRKLLHAQDQLSLQHRLQAAQAARIEQVTDRIAAVAAECYEAEVEAIYESRPAVRPPSLESVTGEAVP